MTSRRLLHPPDVGAEAKDVVDPDMEQKMAVGMVIRSDQFPDKLFAPPKRTDLMADGVNPIFDKEMRSELFGQGTLMLRLVIQLSMLLALPLMAVCLYIKAAWAAVVRLLRRACSTCSWGRCFPRPRSPASANAERSNCCSRPPLSPWHILTGKLLSGLRVSCVLTAFIIWPLFLAWLLPPWTYLADSWTILRYLIIVALTALTTTVLAMFCSVIFSKTSVSLMTTYLVLLLLYRGPGRDLGLRPGVLARACATRSRSPRASDRHRMGRSAYLAAHLDIDQPDGGRLQLAVDGRRDAEPARRSQAVVGHAATAFMAFYLLSTPSARRDPLAVSPPLAGVVVTPFPDALLVQMLCSVFLPCQRAAQPIRSLEPPRHA